MEEEPPVTSVTSETTETTETPTPEDNDSTIEESPVSPETTDTPTSDDSDLSTEESPVSPENPETPTTETSHTTRNALIIVLVIVVILALFFGLFFGLRGCNNDEPDEVNPDPEIVEPGPEDPDSTGDDGETSHTEHTWVWECDDEGHWQVCSVCGETTTKEDHELTYTEEDSTYHLVTCDICGYETTIEHTFGGYISDGENGHYQVCIECEYTTTTTDHNLGSYIADSENGHYKECSECDYRTTDEEHNLSYVSVDDTYHHQACSECSYTTGSEEHSYGSETLKVKDTSTLAYVSTCETCGYTKEVDEAHTFDFSNDTWEIIDAVAASGLANQIYSVEDTKTINVGEEEHTIRIDDFNHDDLTTKDENYNDGEHAAITCEMVDILSQTHVMNEKVDSSSTNAGGWYSSAMRKYLNTEEGCVLSTLNEDLQAVIKKVDKKATAGSQSTDIVTSSDSLFLLAYAEIDSSSSTAVYKNEGTVYEYWNTHNTQNNRIKKRDGTDAMWWTRTPNTGNSTAFYAIYSSGSWANGYGASSLQGVSFAFCI